jgi:excisionase family DNA binding protein
MSAAFPFIAADRVRAAEACGVGTTTIDEAVRDDELIAHYVGTKPVFRAADLDEWIRSLPTEKAGRAS